MKFELLSIDKKQYLDSIKQYLEEKENKKALNEAIYNILSTEAAISNNLIAFNQTAIEEFESHSEVMNNMISNILTSRNPFTGNKNYNYIFYTEQNEDKITCFLKVERKDNKIENYWYYLETPLKLLKNSDLDINSMAFERIKTFIDLMYNFSEEYLGTIVKQNKEFDQNHFMKELAFIGASDSANDVCVELNIGAN